MTKVVDLDHNPHFGHRPPEQAAADGTVERPGDIVDIRWQTR